MARKKPLPKSEQELSGRNVKDRSKNIRRRDTDEVKNVSIGLMDIDAAIVYYFNEVIKPTVVESGETIKVPLLYANAERWSSIQKSGFLRDRKRQIILPVIAFKRNSIEKDETVPIDKLDANDPKLHYTFEKKYTKENRYDRFSVLQGITPSKELHSIAMPDYVTISYSFIIWTTYIEQMNKIVERINWSEGSYWGDPGRFKFRVSIDSFSDASELSDAERMVKTEFTVSLRGYLLPESFNNLVNTQKSYTPKKIVTTISESEIE